MVRQLTWPQGPVVELACRRSSKALELAQEDHQVMAVDISDVALTALKEEAQRRGLAEQFTFVQADLRDWNPGYAQFAMVLCVRYWEKCVFRSACQALMPDGLIVWETFTTSHLKAHPGFNPEWCLEADEPACLLPSDFKMLWQEDSDDGQSATRCFAARRSR